MRRSIHLLILSFLILTNSPATGQVRIALSKASNNYVEWLKNAEPDAFIVNMYGCKIDSALELLSTCSGLLLTGGEDVNPAWYGKENELSKCEEIDDYRDSLEFALIKRATASGMPVFGICRGEQILNVAFGGTLFTDIPTDIGSTVIHRGSLHIVTVDRQTELFKVTGVHKDTVNSFHHQAIDKPAAGFKISAVSENGVKEAIERESPEGKSFIMAVQWHPERLTRTPELSEPLADCFLEQIRKYSKR